MQDTLIVQNYGVFWERAHLDAGSKGPGNRGTLNGFRRRDKNAVDFRRQRGIYVLYEGLDIASQRVAYVGQTGSGEQRLLRRLHHHERDHLWNRWQRFSWLGFLPVSAEHQLDEIPTSGFEVGLSTALDQLESTLIQLLEPLLNKQGPKWHGAKQYFQVPIEADEKDDA